MPVVDFLLEGGLAAFAEGIGLGLVLGDLRLIIGETEAGLLDLEVVTPLWMITTDLLERFMADRMEAQLIEHAQQPRGGEVFGAAIAIPHLQRAADELIAAGAFHAIHAQIGAADAHRVLGGPGTCRVVLGGHQPLARVQRRGHRCAEIDIAEAHHQIAGVEYRLAHCRLIGEAIDAANEFQIARAPGGVRAHRALVLVDGLLTRRVIPGQRQVHGAGLDLDVLDILERDFGLFEMRHQCLERQAARVVMQLQRADAGGHLHQTGQRVLLEPQHPGMGAEAQRDIQLHLAEFDQQEVIAGAAIDDLLAALLGAQAFEHRRVIGARTFCGDGAQRGAAGLRLALFQSVELATGEGGDHGVLLHLDGASFLQSQRDETDAIAGGQLAQLPAFGTHHGGRTYEAAQ